MPARGCFITLEGLEGVGKTTNRDYVEQQLRASKIDVLCTREPGGTPLGEQLRNLLLHADNPVSAETELLMMAASRKQHVDDVIQPALNAGRCVLCDRFADASMAYQGGGRELGVQRIADLHKLMNIAIAPDLTLLLDMPVKDGMARVRGRGEPDRIEKETLAFFERARAAYLQLAEQQPDRVKVVDASQSLDQVQQQIDTYLQGVLEKLRG